MIKEYILQLANILIEVYFYAMLIYIFSSWIPPLRESRLMEWIGNLVEPYLGFFRRFIPPVGFIDFSPVLALLVYHYLMQFAYIGLSTVLDWIFP